MNSRIASHEFYISRALLRSFRFCTLFIDKVCSDRQEVKGRPCCALSGNISGSRPALFDVPVAAVRRSQAPPRQLRPARPHRARLR